MLMSKLMIGYRLPPFFVKLNRTQWRTLFILSMMEKPNMSQISRSMNMEKGSITSVVDGLISAGLVKRVQDQNDRRKVLLELTAESQKIVEQGKAHIGKHIQSRLDQLEDAEIEQLFQALSSIQTIAGKL